MPLKVSELRPGDRVVLHCAGTAVPRREGVFQGTVFFDQLATFLVQTIQVDTIHLHDGDVHEEVPTNGEVSVYMLFFIEDDGRLTDCQDRQISIEERVVMGKG